MHAPRKRLGQHFLHDDNVIRRIVAAISPAADEHFAEIGPGPGALTRPLAKACGRLDIIEVDTRFAEALRDEFRDSQTVQVHQADALSFDFAQLTDLPRGLRVAGNLPYNISTPLLFHLAKFSGLVSDMHFMLQKEVVDRMVAAPGSKTYGRLTIMLSRWFDVDACFDIKPNSFSPPPKVMSSVVRMQVRTKPRFAVRDEARFADIVAGLFSMRRKTLGRALRGKLTAEQIEALNIDPRARAETLQPEQFAQLADASLQDS